MSDQILIINMTFDYSMIWEGGEGSPVHGLAKRRPEMGAQGFTGDSFNGNFCQTNNTI